MEKYNILKGGTIKLIINDSSIDSKTSLQFINTIKELGFNIEKSILAVFSRVILHWSREQKICLKIVGESGKSDKYFVFENSSSKSFREQVSEAIYSDTAVSETVICIDKIIYDNEILIEWELDTSFIDAVYIDDIEKSLCDVFERVAADADTWERYISIPLKKSDEELIYSVNRTEKAIDYMPLKTILERSFRK
jgi:hypothetical protein